MESAICEEKTLLVHPSPPFPFALHRFPDRFLPLCFLFRPHLPSPFLLRLFISSTGPRNRTLGFRKGIGRRGLDSGVWTAMMVEPVRMVRDMVF